MRAVQTVLTTAWLRAHGARCRLARCRGRFPVITGGRRISIGYRVGFSGKATPVSLGASSTGSLSIGDHCFFNQGSAVFSAASIRIGNHVLVADYAAIYDTDFHELSPGDPVRAKSVTIEDDVWIGRGAIILPGVSIGRGSVVAAGAVVTRDVPEFSVVAGNPGTVVRTLPTFPSGVHRARL